MNNNRNRNKSNKSQAVLQVEQSYSGPIPQAHELQKYEDVQKGFAERLILMAEKEQQNRHTELALLNKNQHLTTTEELKITSRGQFFGIMSVLSVLGVAVYGYYLGDTDMPSKVIIAVVVGLAGVFVTSRLKKGSE